MGADVRARGGSRTPAVIFDLDGVLVDSEPNYFEAERRLFAQYGIDFTPQAKRPFIGRGTREMLEELAVASGSSPQVIDVVLEAAGIRHLFDVVVSAEAVPRGKPAPDVFLAAAAALGVAPADCVVVEDSGPGVVAAEAAGMRCVAVPYVLDPLDQAFARADLLVGEGMAGFVPEAVQQWILGPGGAGAR